MEPVLFAVFASAFGAVTGSFCATAALRLERGEGVLSGRSRCDGCARPLNWAQTVPVAGYALARGRCQACGHGIDGFHLLGEASGALLAGAVLWIMPSATGVLMAMIGLTLLGLSLIDIKTLRLPDVGNAIVAGLCLLLAVLRGHVWEGHVWEGLVAAALSAAGLCGLKWYLERRSRQTLLGLGDIKLIAALALGLGQWAAATVAAASLLGLAAIVILRKTANDKLPFGPFIAASGFAALLMLQAGGGA